MSDKAAMSDKTAMSNRTALGEEEQTALSEETALSESIVMPDTAATAGTAAAYEALMSRPVFGLDCWLVYPTRNLIQFCADEVGDNQEQRQLEPRLMRLLCLLAASADSVVSRDDIITVLWPRVVVNENSLTRAVSDLRRCLTPPGAQRTTLIQTIPKRGYRLAKTPALDTPTVCPVTNQHQSAVQASRPSLDADVRRWIKRWTPSIAACLMLALAVVLRVSDEGESNPLMAQFTTPHPTLAEHDKAGSQPIYDRVLGSSEPNEGGLTSDAKALPTNLTQGADAPFPITRLGSASADALQTLQRAADEELKTGQSMLTPDGQLLAYVDFRDGISSLNLRPALTEADPWVAFTTDEQIFHLQWSPLDAGILLTVGRTADNKDQPSYLRLMLLDLDTLTLQELYRRELPRNPDWLHGIGNLT